MSNLCVICEDEILEGYNDTEEHIIPNAIGGFVKVTGFICNGCNRKTGSSWDAELAKQLSSLGLMLDIKRERGEPKSMKFETISGKSIRLDKEGKMELAIPELEEIPTKNGMRIKARTGNMFQAEQLLKGMKRKYKNASLDSSVLGAVSEPSEPIMVNINFGGNNAGRSLIKSCLALIHYHDYPTTECLRAINYLKGDDTNPPFGYYYTSDPIVNRAIGIPLHCIYVRGVKDTGQVIAYVEYYGFKRMLAHLSDGYTGDDFEVNYSVNPLTGETLEIKIDLSLTSGLLDEVLDYKHYDSEKMRDALAPIVQRTQEISFEKYKNKHIENVIFEAFEHFGVKPGEALQDENREEFFGIITMKLAEFYAEHMVHQEPKQ